MVKIEKTQYIGDGSFPEEEEIDDDLEDEVDSLIREAEKIKSNTSGFNIKTNSSEFTFGVPVLQQEEPPYAIKHSERRRQNKQK